jgi:membrane fusion protein (multidrug efflux system)
VGQAANLTVDSLPKQIFKGKITAINPVVELDTRNVKIQVTVKNPKYELTPGMFATINVETDSPKQLITLPQTAISYNPYGNIIYVLNYLDTDKKGVKEYRATQQFVMTGETRGDQVAILSGIKKGDLVVTSGQLKLTNNATVTIDNSTVPKNNPAPTPREE